jgi:hypothetical protein
MRRALIALALLAAAETAAIACSCVMAPRDPAERQQLARSVAERAVALVEVEVVSAYDPKRWRGERLRVRRTIAGRAPRLVSVERLSPPSGAACDLVLHAGQRTTVLLYPVGQGGAGGSYTLSSSCTSSLLADAPFRAALIQEMRRPRWP